MTLTNSTRTQIFFATLLLMITGQAVLGDAGVYSRTVRSTTWVLAKTSSGTSSGAGVLVDKEKKLVITNAHVVGDSRNTVVFFADMKKDRPVVERDHYLDNVKKLGIRGRVISVDRKRDLAMIELEKLPKGIEAVEMADDSVTPGEDVQSIGNAGTTEALWVYSSGKVRAVYQKQFRTGSGEHDFRVVETDSPINSGDSGGPVVNSKGQLVAITQAISKKARLVSYSVDISEVKDFMAAPWKAAPLPVKELLETADLAFTQHEDTGHYQVDLGDDDDDKTAVFVTKDIEYFKRADARKIWSLAHVSKDSLTTTQMTRLLEQSARTKIGSWTLEQNKDGESMVIYVVKLDATATHETMKSTMEYVAKLTAAMKKEMAPESKTETATDTLNKWLQN